MILTAAKQVVEQALEQTSKLVNLSSALVICTSACLLYLWQEHKSRPSYPPGPWRWPVIGSLYLPLVIRFKDMLQMANYLADTYGDVTAFWAGSRLLVFLNSYDAVRSAFIDNEEMINDRPSQHINQQVFGPLPTGILMNNGPPHRAMRRFTLLAMRDFGVGKQSLEEKIQQETDALTRTFQSANGAPIDDIRRLLMMGVANIIISICFGSRKEYDDPNFLRILDSVDALFKNANPSSLAVASKTFSRLDPNVKAMEKAVREVRAFVLENIAEHRKDFDKANIRDFIDLYLLSEEENTEYHDVDNIFQVVMDLFVAGAETTSSTLTWGLLYMMRNPDVQDQVQSEIDFVVGPNQPVKLSDRSNLVFVEATLNEVWRLGNVAPLGVGRCASKAFTINGYCIPRGAIVRPNIYRIHMDPAYWHEPEVFRPQRWIGRHGKLMKHKHFMPFSIGKRNCVGEHLARHEAFLFFTAMLQKFTFVPPADAAAELPLDDGVVVLSRQPKPYKLRAIRRK